MKNKLQLTGMLSSVILLVCSCAFLIRAGYAGDEYGLSNSSFEGFNALYGYFLWTGLALGILVLLIFLCNLFSKSIKSVLIGISLLMALIIIVFEPNYKDLSNAVDSYEDVEVVPNILEISWEETEDLIKENRLNFIYIGRDNCPYCVEFEQRLNELAIDSDVTIYYYNTINDREEISEEFQERMDYLGVNSVPAMLIVGNGNFEKLDSDDIDSLLEQVKENLYLMKEG